MTYATSVERLHEDGLEIRTLLGTFGRLDRNYVNGITAMSAASQESHPSEVGVQARSKLVHEALTLTPRQKVALGVSELQLAVAELLFKVCVLLIDDDDPRPPLERIDDIESLLKNVDQESLREAVAAFADGEPQLPSWLARAGSPGYQRFLRRFMGAARFDRMRSALQADGAVLFVAARRSLRYLLPVATAADNCIRALTAEQRAEIEGLEKLADSSLLELAVTVDAAMNNLIDKGLDVDVSVARPDELDSLPGSLGDIALTMSGKVSAQCGKLIEELSATLARKVQGARDALRFSADPVSQAANSLVELIDRLLREAFETEFVMAWLRRWYPDRLDDLTYARSGTVMPTKRGQALCFAYAGGDVGGPSLVHDLAAAALVSLRSRLQGLKHADEATEAEKELLVTWLASIESTLVITCKLAWLGSGAEQLEALKGRLSPAA